MKTVTLLLVSGCLFSGCAALQVEDPYQKEMYQLRATQRSFASVVRLLASMRKLGEFDEEEQRVITMIINQANEYLKEWEASIEVQASRPDLHSLLLKTIDTLEAYYLSRLDKAKEEAGVEDPNTISIRWEVQEDDRSGFRHTVSEGYNGRHRHYHWSYKARQAG